MRLGQPSFRGAGLQNDLLNSNGRSGRGGASRSAIDRDECDKPAGDLLKVWRPWTRFHRLRFAGLPGGEGRIVVGIDPGGTPLPPGLWRDTDDLWPGIEAVRCDIARCMDSAGYLRRSGRALDGHGQRCGACAQIWHRRRLRCGSSAHAWNTKCFRKNAILVEIVI
jgi:hypothetical protein